MKWAGIGLIGLTLLFGARPLFRWFKSTRATQLATQANTLAASGKFNAAADKFRAALHLDPLNFTALEGAAQLASRIGRPEAVGLWEQVLKDRRTSVADRQGYVEQLLRVGRPRLAASTVDRLIKEDPSAKTFELASLYWRSLGESAKAIQFARLAVKSSPNDDVARYQLAVLLAVSTDPADRTEARTILWNLSQTSGSHRQAAIEALASSPELSDTERRQILELLGSISPETIKDSLLAADQRLQLQTENPQQIYDQIIARWIRGNASELVKLAQWLNVHQQAERVLTLFSLDDALKNTQLLLVRLDALAALQRWNEIDTVLARGDLTLDPSVLECFRARAAQEQNATLDAETHWNHAIVLASGDPAKLKVVAEFAEQSRASAAALKAYDQLARFPEHAAVAYRGTERLSGHAEDLSVQRAAAEKIKSVSDDPNAVAQLAYLNLLAGNDVDKNTEIARQLVTRYPDRLAFRVTAALGCLRQHDPGLALSQFKGPSGAPPIDWRKTPPSWRAVYVAVLRANEQNSAAQEIVSGIPVNQLLPEERALLEGKQEGLGSTP
jgi:tetratricopeptide (TPR) repeat protein